VVGADQCRAESRRSRFAQAVLQFDAVDAIAELIVGQYSVDSGLLTQ
jgi:hypothetical protein